MLLDKRTIESDLPQRGIQTGAIRSMSVTTFVAARRGPVFTAVALEDLQTPGSDGDTEMLKREYLELVTTILKVPS